MPDMGAAFAKVVPTPATLIGPSHDVNPHERVRIPQSGAEAPHLRPWNRDGTGVAKVPSMHANTEADTSSRFDCGRSFPRRVQVDTALASMTPMLRCLAGSAVALTTCSMEPIPPVFIEPRDLERIASALVANARNAMPHGGRIRISTSTVDAPPLGASLSAPERLWVLLQVDDEGIGMDDATLARALAGSGTGLASVLRAVRNSSGELWIHSDVGRGTRVQVRLPVR
jgi:hypothetical protein